MPSRFVVDPPLLNSSSPWATTLEDLRALYNCPYTGAITTRTSLIHGFSDNSEYHQHCFFNAGGAAEPNSARHVEPDATSSSIVDLTSAQSDAGNSTLNTYGYSPISLSQYLEYIDQLVDEQDGLVAGESHNIAAPSSTSFPPTVASTSTSRSASATTTTVKVDNQGAAGTPKVIIISVTGSPDEVGDSYRMVHEFARAHQHRHQQRHGRENGCPRLAIEVNLSCPNIAGKPPPAYNKETLIEYLDALHDAKQSCRNTTTSTSTKTAHPSANSATADNVTDHSGTEIEVEVFMGLKLPPYTYLDQFINVISAIRSTHVRTETKVVDFLSSTNTLGSSLVLENTTQEPALRSEAGTGIGGMAGSAIHALSLGNVSTLRRLLDGDEVTRDVVIVGIGGVSDRAGFLRMKSVGASAVGVASALGRSGVGIFEQIMKRA